MDERIFRTDDCPNDEIDELIHACEFVRLMHGVGRRASRVVAEEHMEGCGGTVRILQILRDVIDGCIRANSELPARVCATSKT